METLGFPHFEFFGAEKQFENVMFELIIILFVLSMWYCFHIEKKAEPERKKREALEQKRFEAMLRSHCIDVPKRKDKGNSK
jgi:hypothetical protein